MKLTSCGPAKVFFPATVFPCHAWSHQHKSQRPSQLIERPRVRCQGFMDQLTDYINGGPKLRKWYGEGDLPVDGGNPIVSNMPEPEDIAPEDIERDAVLVTEADSPTGEQVVLQLILARLPIKIITQDAEEAKRGYGPYVTAFAGDVGINQSRGINFGALFGTEQALLKDPKRELAVQQSGIPFTIVRAGKIQNRPGSNMQLSISQDDQISGEISREDVARVLAGALQAPPEHGLVFQVTASGPGRPPEDWVSTLSQLSAASVS
ncbi:TPA: hypothetical protein ACH3X2_010724 [Trebouxia sp. C0005]|nr:MAG: hypothetical protein FRX49_12605 [Trebouxia sp. A1-2]